MAYYKTLSDNKAPLAKTRVGGEVETHCGKCKQETSHTIVALDPAGKSPIKVMCNRCKSQHVYKKEKATPAPKKEKAVSALGPKKKPSTRKTSESLKPASAAVLWKKTMEGRNPGTAKVYSFETTFAAKDLLRHPKFGLGFVHEVKTDGKIVVLFEDGFKTLIHGRAHGAI